jgi:hypothetical protein
MLLPHSLNVGWEANPLHNSGASMYVQSTRTIRITGFQISLSMAPASLVAGICELLATCTIAPPGTSVAFGGGDAGYPGFSPLLTNPDFSAPAAVNNPAKAGIAGFVGYSGYLFSIILKKVQPDAVNQCITRDGLDIIVPVWSLLVFHMDHAGSVTAADCEMQGVINYV